MQFTDALIILVTGFFAGFINTVAGGGSLLTLPILIFMGLPPAVANGTNRVAIFVQNIFAMAGFRSKGVSAFPYALYLGISALFGAIIGAKVSLELDDALFNRVIAIVMIMVVLVTIFNPMKGKGEDEERMDFKHKAIGIFTFFFIGIYGGFIQAGVGFIVIAALTSINGMSLVKTNSAKVAVAFIYTIAALAIFIWEGVIDWKIGLTLAAGNSTGAWVASRWSVKKGDKWIKRFLIIMVTALAIKLWFF